MAQPSWIGQKIGDRYKIESLLGAGGMSSVFKANDPNLRRDVAIKLIHSHLSSQPEFVRRFEEEAAAVARLRHPNLIQVYDFNHDEDTYYIVFEYVSGGSLHDKLKGLAALGDRISIPEAIDLTIKIGEGIGYAHAQGLVHRDVKPPNVLLNKHGQPILTDFGIVKIMGGEGQTQTGSVMGTARYMSPEQIKGVNIDRRTDIYALGVMLYEMVGGRAPFEADSAMTLMMMHIQEAPPDITQFREDVPASLRYIIEKALAKLPQERYQTAEHMVVDLRKMQEGGHISKPMLTMIDTPAGNFAPTIQINAGTKPPSSAFPTYQTAPPEEKPRKTLSRVVIGLGGLFLLTCLTCIFIALGADDDNDPTPTAIVAVATNTVVIEEEAPTATIAPTSNPATRTPPPINEPTSDSLIFYEETFDELGDWGTQKDEDVNATVRDGVFDFTVIGEDRLFWTTAGEYFDDGIYELEASAVDGTLDNGFGFLFRFDHSTNSFYAFELGSDGYTWISYCERGCETVDVLVGDDWFPTDAINQGIGETNILKVVADGSAMTFYVNDIEVGRVKDGRLAGGDIAIFVQSFEGQGGVEILFDNFIVRELE